MSPAGDLVKQRQLGAGVGSFPPYDHAGAGRVAGEEEGLVGPALADLIRREPEPVVAATACVAAGPSCPNGSEALIGALSTRRDSANRGERWSAVLGLTGCVQGRGVRIG